jgi:signal recognition particle GTPase
MSGLLKKISDMKITENEGFMESLQKGHFTLRNMVEHISSILGMGPLQQIMVSDEIFYYIPLFLEHDSRFAEHFEERQWTGYDCSIETSFDYFGQYDSRR